MDMESYLSSDHTVSLLIDDEGRVVDKGANPRVVRNAR